MKGMEKGNKDFFETETRLRKCKIMCESMRRKVFHETALVSAWRRSL